MHRSRGQAWRRLARSERGISTLEFAFISPFMFILVFASLELALDMIVDASVQVAAEVASRVSMTGTAPATGTRDQQAIANVHSILDMWTAVGGTVSVQTLAYASYNNLGTSNYASGTGGFGNIVTYTITVKMPAFTGIPNFFGLGTLTFNRNFIVQNES